MLGNSEELEQILIDLEMLETPPVSSMIEVPKSPGLNHIYEQYFYFGELQATMAMPNTANGPSPPPISALNSTPADIDKQTLPSIADWTLTKPPEPKFTRQMHGNTASFIENNMNNFTNNNNNNSLAGLLSADAAAEIGSQLNNKEQEVSAFLQQLATSNQKLTEVQESDNPSKQPQKFLNRYIAVLDQSSQAPEAPTFEPLARNRYACNLCKEVVNSVHEKFIHRNKHLGRTFQCQYCGTVFPTSIDVVRHVHIMHRNSQKCPKCDYVATDKDTFFAHLDKAHPINLPPQNHPQLIDNTSHQQQLSPPQVPPIVVTPHSYSSSSSDSCSSPPDYTLSGPSPKKPRLSPKTPKSTKSPRSPRKYGPKFTPNSTELENFSMACELCKGKSTILSCQQQYIKHVMERHVPDDSCVCPFRDCFKEFEDEPALNKHLHCHTVLRKFKCSQCSKAFKTLSQSKKHEDEVHTNSDLRPYVCTWPDCDKRFKATKHLQVHYMIHTDQKPIACEYCEYRCRQRNSINYHYKTKHPGCDPPKVSLPALPV